MLMEKASVVYVEVIRLKIFENNLHSHKYDNQFLYECKKTEINNYTEMKYDIYIKVNYWGWL